MLPLDENMYSCLNDDYNACLYLQQSSTQPCHHAWSSDCQDHVGDSSDQWECPYPTEKLLNVQSYDACNETIYAHHSCHLQYSSTEASKSMDMHSVLVRPPAKRHHDDVDMCNCSLKRTCRQEGSVPEFPRGREGFDSPPFNNTFTVRNIDGVTKSLELDDLVDMVLQVTKNIEDSDIAEHIVHLSKRRQQNKAAAARYRDKQKERKQNLQKEQADLEMKNVKLKAMISDLEREVADYKRKIMRMASDLNR